MAALATELTISIYMSEEDLKLLCSDVQAWGVDWDIPNRYMTPNKLSPATPSFVWAKAYWVGARRADLVLARNFIRANRKTSEIIWDTMAGVETSPGVFEGSYVILTDYTLLP